MIVHDLKNPISSIIGFAELADDSDIGKETRSGYLKTIEIEAYRLSDMSHDILDFVKGEFKIKKEMILIKSFIEEIQKFIYPDIKQFNINLIIDLKYYSIAYLDTDRMRRVILNIFSNSVDALINSGKDSPTFSIKTFEENNFIIMQLSDNGPGISPQIIKSLFQPFATYGKYNGTGLGMAQVKGIIEAHNGTVTFESSDQGTTFFLKIPISREIK
jgi:signal transduction histidine kinase